MTTCRFQIDNLEPDEISKKSLKVLDKKLQMLAEHAEFHVNINSVVGGGFKDPNDALVIGKRALELGFESTIGIIHDGSGQLKPLKPDEAQGLLRHDATARRPTTRSSTSFRKPLPKAEPNDWRCRAGSRYLYICEDGLVHYCSQQRGYPGVPIAEYTTADVKREFLTAKSCAPNCTIGCVHRISHIDHWRAPQTKTVSPGGQGAGEYTDVAVRCQGSVETEASASFSFCGGRDVEEADPSLHPSDMDPSPGTPIPLTPRTLSAGPQAAPFRMTRAVVRVRALPPLLRQPKMNVASSHMQLSPSSEMLHLELESARPAIRC